MVNDAEGAPAKRQKTLEDEEDEDDGVLVVSAAAAIMAEPVRTLVPPDRRIDFFEEWGGGDCDNMWRFTHFRRGDLLRLVDCLRLPAVIKVGGRGHATQFDCNDALVILLLRYASADSCLSKLYSWSGWHETALSRIINWMIRHIYKK